MSSSRKQLLETTWIYSTNVEPLVLKEKQKTDEPIKVANKKQKRKAKEVNLNTSASLDDHILAEEKTLVSPRESSALGVKDSVELPVKKLIKKKKLTEASVDKKNEEQGDNQPEQGKNLRASDTQNLKEKIQTSNKSAKEKSKPSDLNVAVVKRTKKDQSGQPESDKATEKQEKKILATGTLKTEQSRIELKETTSVSLL